MPAAGSAGQDQAALRHREPQLPAFGVAAEAPGKNAFAHIAQHRGREACGIRVDEEEKRFLRQDVGAERDKGPEILFQLPDFAARPAAVGGRIHDDGVVTLAAADFPLDELLAVVDNPAYGRFPHAAGGGVLLCPGNHALCRIHVADFGAGLQTGNRGRAGIGKEVQHADGPARGTDLPHGPVPVGCLFRKEARVLKVHRPDAEGQFPVGDLPAFGHGVLLPAAPAALAADITGVAGMPVFIPARRIPDCLRVRTDQIHVAPAFELLAPRTVEQLIVSPVAGNPHILFVQSVSPLFPYQRLFRFRHFSGSLTTCRADPGLQCSTPHRYTLPDS